ncbi:MAG: hypothetical protein KGJ93_04440, partial [Patescibacteria group bacterium]|nr:hypothetical protein [Patescibacteria group bacterium]
ASPYVPGPRLIKLENDSTVYWVSPGGLKIPMISAAVFLSYHNKWSDVQTVGQEEFDSYANAQYIWLNGTGAIYKIDNGTRQQIAPDAWNNSGLDASQVIWVNRTDFNTYKAGPAITAANELNSSGVSLQ